MQTCSEKGEIGPPSFCSVTFPAWVEGVGTILPDFLCQISLVQPFCTRWLYISRGREHPIIYTLPPIWEFVKMYPSRVYSTNVYIQKVLVLTSFCMPHCGLYCCYTFKLLPLQAENSRICLVSPWSLSVYIDIPKGGEMLLTPKGQISVIWKIN